MDAHTQLNARKTSAHKINSHCVETELIVLLNEGHPKSIKCIYHSHNSQKRDYDAFQTVFSRGGHSAENTIVAHITQ